MHGAQGSESNGKGLREPSRTANGPKKVREASCDLCLSRRQPEKIKAFQEVETARAEAQNVERQHVSGSSRWPYEAGLGRLAGSEAELGLGVGPLAVGDGQPTRAG